MAWPSVPLGRNRSGTQPGDNGTGPQNPTASPESLRLQLTEALLMVRTQSMLLIQAIGFYVAADVLLVTYGFAHRTLTPFLLAALMPFVMLNLYIYMRVESIVAIWVAMVAEEELGLGDRALATVFGKIRMEYIFGILDSDKLKLSDETTLDELLKDAPRKSAVRTKVRSGFA